MNIPFTPLGYVTLPLFTKPSAPEIKDNVLSFTVTGGAGTFLHHLTLKSGKLKAYYVSVATCATAAGTAVASPLQTLYVTIPPSLAISTIKLIHNSTFDSIGAFSLQLDQLIKRVEHLEIACYKHPEENALWEESRSLEERIDALVPLLLLQLKGRDLTT